MKKKLLIPDRITAEWTRAKLQELIDTPGFAYACSHVFRVLTTQREEQLRTQDFEHLPDTDEAIQHVRLADGIRRALNVEQMIREAIYDAADARSSVVFYLDVDGALCWRPYGTQRGEIIATVPLWSSGCRNKKTKKFHSLAAEMFEDISEEIADAIHAANPIHIDHIELRVPVR